MLDDRLLRDSTQLVPFQKRLVRFLPPLSRGDRAGFMQTEKNLPRPFLVKEGRKTPDSPLRNVGSATTV